jgi:pyruvate dehydrogenase E2 component (dihydrolipoamide acetyltransferase)
MPQMGYDMQEGTVVRWLKAEGSNVEIGEPVAEIETDKAVVEFESYAEGVLQKILVNEGTTVPVGEVIAIVGEDSEVVGTAAEPEGPAPVAEPEPTEEETHAAIPLGAASVPPSDGTEPASEPEEPRQPQRVLATPIARQIAAEAGIDLAMVEGTGPGGRVTKDDVQSVVDAMTKPEPEPEAEPEPEPEPVEAQAEVEVEAEPEPETEEDEDLVPLSKMRQQIARVTIRSKSEKPHFYVNTDVDMTAAMTLRAQINQALAADGVRATVNDLIIAASVLALKRYPKFNAYYEDGGIRMNDDVNVGVAMAVEEGLILPAIVGAGDMSLKEVAQASKDLSDRAQQGTLSPQEYSGGTFAISNMGMMGVTSFVAIIQPPQSAVLAVGAVQKRPVVTDDDQVVVRQMMTATLSADHRIVDGAEGAMFLNEIKDLLESPLSIIL